MPDQRSVMKEFRSLEQKRATEGLSPAEEARLAELRELVGPEAGAGGLRGGFDVSAAAARLRESLVPAGTRNRAPPPEPEAPIAPEPQLSAADALANAYAADPFAPLETGGAADALFDASTLDPDVPPAEGGALAGDWDPAAALDPAAPYDPASQAYADAGQGEDASSAWQPPEAFPPAEDAAQAAYATEAAADAPGPEAPAWEPAQPFDPNAP